MKSVLNLTTKQRADLFNATSQEIGMHSVMVEKDFWVCWTLKQLFDHPNLREHIIFKGGTSLSKVWRAIERFSEDIDISISRSSLGFGGDQDPENAPSNKKRKTKLEELSNACAERIKNEVLPCLQERAQRELLGEKWDIKISETDPQTLFFEYPTAISEHGVDYIPRLVKIEAGARSDDWPADTKQIQPYVAEAYSEQITDCGLTVRALSIQRTFWEKATILHAEANRPNEKPTPIRFSRHYSDLATLSLTEEGTKAKVRNDLLDRVVEHKKTFFASNWAHYNTAVRGQFKLIPSEARMEDLRTDYQKMQQMFFGDAMAWNDVISNLQKLEQEINSF